MKPNSNGTLLWNQRITEGADETATSVRITLIVPVVWMHAFDKTTDDQRDSIRSKVGDGLYYRLQAKPDWDILKYTLLEVHVIDLHKDYIRVKVILNKKI